jgi:hypothetical protein
MLAFGTGKAQNVAEIECASLIIVSVLSTLQLLATRNRFIKSDQPLGGSDVHNFPESTRLRVIECRAKEIPLEGFA